MKWIGMRVAIRLAVLSVTVAAAQSPMPMSADRCASMSDRPPADYAGWAAPVALAAAADAAAAPALPMPGKAARIALRPTPRVRYALPPGKPGDPASHGGMVAFDVVRPGAYRIALSSGAWIDIVRDGRTIASSAHGHGPACSGIVKMVDFSLSSGRYLLQIAGGAAPEITAMVSGPR